MRNVNERQERFAGRGGVIQRFAVSRLMVISLIVVAAFSASGCDVVAELLVTPTPQNGDPSTATPTVPTPVTPDPTEIPVPPDVDPTAEPNQKIEPTVEPTRTLDSTVVPTIGIPATATTPPAVPTPTSTPVLPTATVVPPTPTPVLPTATVVPPTPTPTPTQVPASGMVTLSLEPASESVRRIGERIAVAVNADLGQPAGAASVTVSFDDSTVQLVAVESGDLFGPRPLVVEKGASGYGRATYTAAPRGSQAESLKNGSLARFIFEVVSTEAGTAEFSIVNADMPSRSNPSQSIRLSTGPSRTVPLDTVIEKPWGRLGLRLVNPVTVLAEGEYMTVAVDGTLDELAGAATVDLRFDPTLVRLVTVNPGSLLGDSPLVLESGEVVPGTARYTAAPKAEMPARLDGDLARFRFQVISSAPAEAVFHVDSANIVSRYEFNTDFRLELAGSISVPVGIDPLVSLLVNGALVTGPRMELHGGSVEISPAPNKEGQGFEPGTPITVQPVADPGFQIDCRTEVLTITEDTNIHCESRDLRLRLTINGKDIAGGAMGMPHGIVSVTPAVNGPAAMYMPGTRIEIELEPFSGWEILCSATALTLTTSMNVSCDETPIIIELPPDRWEQSTLHIEPKSLPSNGGRVTVGMATQEFDGSSPRVKFTLTGHGLNQESAGNLCAVAVHNEASPKYTSRCWNSQFQLPANSSTSARTYTVTVSSPDIAGTISGTVTVAGSAPADRWEQSTLHIEPRSLPSNGGRVTVGMATQEFDGSSPRVKFTLTGHGLNQESAGNLCAVAVHNEASPKYTSRCWNSQFQLPANSSTSARTYTVTVSSPDIEGTISGTVTVAGSVPADRWEQSTLHIEPRSLPSNGGRVTVGMATQEFDGSSPRVNFTLTGHGLNQESTGNLCAVAVHNEASPKYTSRCWNSQFQLPANSSASARTYTVTVSSPDIAGTISGTVTVAGAAVSEGSGTVVSFDFCYQVFAGVPAECHGRTNTFSSSDSQASFVIVLDNVTARQEFSFVWNDPNGNVVRRFSNFTYGDNGPGTYWVWGALDIAGMPWAGKKGTWQAGIEIDGGQVFLANFTLT